MDGLDMGRGDTDGRHVRDKSEKDGWCRGHDLSYFDGHVHFPDARIEYEEPDGRWDHTDIEIVTLHYRGAHGAAASRSGFTSFRGSSAQIEGSSPFNPAFPHESFPYPPTLPPHHHAT